MGRMMRWLLVVLGLGVLTGCGSDSMLEVKPFHLRDLELVGELEQPLIRAEQQRRFFGAVSVAEREQRLGYYYSVKWRTPEEGEGARVVFEFRQASTASAVRTMEQEFAAGQTSGTAEFQIIGDDYLKGGRVLAWKVSLFQGDELLTTRQSYLWE